MESDVVKESKILTNNHGNKSSLPDTSRGNKVNPKIKADGCIGKEMFDQSLGEQVVGAFVYIAIGGGVLLSAAICIVAAGDRILSSMKN